MSRVSRALGALASLVLLFALAAPASAHDTLLASNPAEGAALDAPPTEVVLEMSATALELGTEIQVLDGAGTNVVTGSPTIADRFVTAPLGDVAAGEYTVVWRVVSSDGHPIDGTFTFSVTAAPEPTETATPEPVETASPSAEESATPSETASASADASASTEASASATAETVSGVSAGVIAIIVAVAVALVAGVIWLVRRRKSAA